MTEPEAVLEPEAAPPAPRSPRRTRTIVAGVTLLAVVAGGLAFAAGGSNEPAPLALMAGNGTAGMAESTLDAKSATPAPALPANAAGDMAARSSLPYGWGLKFEVEGQLPALPDHAAAWKVNSPDLDRAALTRIASVLGVTGTPVQRDGGWFVEGGDWTLSAYGGDAMGKGGAWYLNLYRSRFNGAADDAPANDPAPGPAISREAAEQRVRDLLDRMGAPKASWRIETTDTDLSYGWACPSPPMSPEELKKLNDEKLRQIERENAASSESSARATSSGATTVADPAPPTASGAGSSGNAASTVAVAPTPGTKPGPDGGCAPPPAPVKGFNVALVPILDGQRSDWPAWNLTLRSDGRIENLSGSWVNFERSDDYKLRGMDAALKDLQSPPVAYATDAPGAIEPTPTVGRAEAPDAASSSGAEAGRRPLRNGVASAPAVDLPAGAPVCPPMPMPMPLEAQDDKATSTMAAPCGPQEPPVVKITGVELGLIQTSVWENGRVRLAMVPSYRFTGRYADGGMPWETSVLALHPSAIAPPPDAPATDGGSGSGVTGVGKAVPPTPTAEPAIARDSSR